MPGSSAECELSCYAQKSTDYSKCQNYPPGSTERASCFALADGELAKCLNACGGGGGGGMGVALAGAAVLAFLIWS